MGKTPHKKIKKKLCGFWLKMKNHRVLKLRSNDLSSLGCLDRVDFLFLGLYSGLDMCGHVAGPVFPFQGRIRRCLAIHAGGIFGHSLASHAFLHDWQAVAFIVAAAGGCHEYTVITFPNSCTDHDTHFLNTFGFNLSKPENRCVLIPTKRFRAVVFQWIPDSGVVNLISLPQKKRGCQSKTDFLFIISI
jgi:hypothetical protein